MVAEVAAIALKVSPLRPPVTVAVSGGFGDPYGRITLADVIVSGAGDRVKVEDVETLEAGEAGVQVAVRL